MNNVNMFYGIVLIQLASCSFRCTFSLHCNAFSCPKRTNQSEGLTNYQTNKVKSQSRALLAYFQTNFAGNLHNNNVPCAVCHVVERHAKVMIPAWKQCPDGWTREYNGYLTSSKYTHKRATFECMDEAPEVTEGNAGNHVGAEFYTVEAHCSTSLPCPNYINGWALTCVICTK